MSLEKDYLKDLFTDEVKGSLKSDGDPVGTAANAVSEHNTSEDAHNDIRLLLAGLTSRLNALADSDDTTLDQVSELVAYIKANRSLIEQVTTGKVSVNDIIDNLTTNVANRPLSASQGVALKALIDGITVPTKVSELQNDAGYLTQHQDISGKANASDLTAHTGNSAIHVTAAEKTKWNQAVTDVGNLSEEIADLKVSQSQIEAPKIVSSVDEMTDPTKHYVLDGYIYHNKEVTTEGETTNHNVFDSSKAELNKRFSISSGSISTSNGYFVTDFIEVPNFQNTTPYNVRLNWEMPVAPPMNDNKVIYFDSSKTKLGGNFIQGENYSLGTGETVIDARTMSSGASGNVAPDFSKVAYIRLQLCVRSSATALTSADIANCEIRLDANEVTTEGTTKQEWVNSGIPYTPTFKTDLVGVLGEGNVIYLSDNLPSGTYTLKYPDDDYATIGTITK